jgi:hypothetical protein
MRKVP